MTGVNTLRCNTVGGWVMSDGNTPRYNTAGDKVFIPCPSEYYPDVSGEVFGVWLSPGEDVCWHVSYSNGKRCITGYTIIQRKSITEFCDE